MHQRRSPKSARRYADYLATRPPQWETDAIRMLIDLCLRTSCPVHIVHLANARCLQMLTEAKDDGVPITVETCPHYLHFAADKVGIARSSRAGDGTRRAIRREHSR